jgi:hypothetical protein
LDPISSEQSKEILKLLKKLDSFSVKDLIENIKIYNKNNNKKNVFVEKEDMRIFLKDLLVSKLHLEDLVFLLKENIGADMKDSRSGVSSFSGVKGVTIDDVIMDCDRESIMEMLKHC